MRSKRCCVVNCKNTRKNSRFQFYKFPSLKLNADQRKKWIAAINKNNANNELPWYPKRRDEICGAHFLNGQKSDDPNSISYIPSVFPLVLEKKIVDKAILGDKSNTRPTGYVNQVITDPSRKNDQEYFNKDPKTKTQTEKDSQTMNSRHNIDRLTSDASTVMAPGASMQDVSTAINKEIDGNTCVDECRACLQRIDKESAYDLFETWFTPWAVRGAIIANDLSKFADVEISGCDQFSKVICPKCYQHLSDACTFMITVQMSDSILRQRVEDNNLTSTANEATSWPQPILLNNRERQSTVEVEVKQEVLSEEENLGNMGEMEQNWEPTMDIKVEPEEITAPVQSNVQINGNLSNCDSTDSMASKCDIEEYLDTTIKQEIPSGDEFMDDLLDLPLDCILCYKVFNSISGLKAHVISDHSYGTVKRKTDGSPPPVKAKIHIKEHTCNMCDQSFATSTDLMVHRASHSGHVCFVCDRKFSSFQQLSRHGPRCQKKSASAARRQLARPPPKRQELSQVLKNNIRLLTEHNNTEEKENKSKSLPIETIVAEKVHELVESWSSSEEMEIECLSEQFENEIGGNAQEDSVKEHQNECIEGESAEHVLENRLPFEEIKEPMKIEIAIGPLLENMQESDQVLKPLLPKVEIKNSVQGQPEDRFSESKNVENGIPEPEIEETEKIEEAKEQSQHKSFNHEIEIEPRVEIQKEQTDESQAGTLSKDSKIELSQENNSSPENIPNIDPELINCNSSKTNQDGLNPKSINDNSLNIESVSSLPSQDPREVLENISSESLQESRIDNSLTEEIKLTNINNHDMPEEKTPTINKMEVHLEINPLDKETTLLETELKDGEKSKSCEPKLVSVISDKPSDIEHF